MKNIEKIIADVDDIRDLLAIVNSTQEFYEIDKDIVLSKLRAVYEDVKDCELQQITETLRYESIPIVPIPEFVAPEPILAPEPEPQPEIEPEPMPVVEIEMKQEIEEEIVEEIVEEKVVESGVPFAIKPPINRSILDTLYGDSPAVTEQHNTSTVKMDTLFDIEPITKPVAQPASEHKVLGEVISSGTMVFNETLSNNKSDIATKLSAQSVTDIRKSIGLNDKFLLMQELFNNDSELYDNTLNELNNFADIDDAFIYLQEHFVLNPNSDAVELLVDLVNRKFS